MRLLAIQDSELPVADDSVGDFEDRLATEPPTVAVAAGPAHQLVPCLWHCLLYVSED